MAEIQSIQSVATASGQVDWFYRGEDTDSADIWAIMSTSISLDDIWWAEGWLEMRLDILDNEYSKTSTFICQMWGYDLQGTAYMSEDDTYWASDSYYKTDGDGYDMMSQQ